LRSKPIEGFENYTIYEDGTIVRNKGSYTLAQPRDSKGYVMVKLRCPKTNAKKTFRLHRLVARHFCEGYEYGLTVDHLDEDKSNNHYTNLEWVSLEENVKRSRSHSCIVEGESYRSISEASRCTRIAISTIRDRIKAGREGYSK